MSTSGARKEAEYARFVISGLLDSGIGVVASMTETRLHALVGALYDTPEIIHVPLSHEQEGVGVCAGAYLTGKKAALVVPNAGLLNCCNGLATLNLLYHLPLLLLVSYRGFMGESASFHAPLGRVTEPILAALEIPYQVVNDPGRLHDAIMEAQSLAQSSSRPVAVLLAGDALIGGRS